jgi:hypothetical protein
MPAKKCDNRIKAKNLYMRSLGKKKLVDIAKELGVSPGLIRKWKSQDKWSDELSVTLPKESVTVTEPKKNYKTVKTKVKGAPKGNKNAYGNKGGKGGPTGNKNALKHGAYATTYRDFLEEEDQAILDAVHEELNLEGEIKLVRYKIASLLRHNETFFYDMFGEKHTKQVSFEDKLKGISILTNDLRLLLMAQGKLLHDTDKLAFDKYRNQIENELKRERLELDKKRLNLQDNDEGEGYGVVILPEADIGEESYELIINQDEEVNDE